MDTAVLIIESCVFIVADVVLGLCRVVKHKKKTIQVPRMMRVACCTYLISSSYFKSTVVVSFWIAAVENVRMCDAVNCF